MNIEPGIGTFATLSPYVIGQILRVIDWEKIPRVRIPRLIMIIRFIAVSPRKRQYANSSSDAFIDVWFWKQSITETRRNDRSQMIRTGWSVVLFDNRRNRRYSRRMRSGVASEERQVLATFIRLSSLHCFGMKAYRRVRCDFSSSTWDSVSGGCCLLFSSWTSGIRCFPRDTRMVECLCNTYLHWSLKAFDKYIFVPFIPASEHVNPEVLQISTTQCF